MNICVECKHHNGVSRAEPWHSHYCNHPETLEKERVDPVTGAAKSESGRRRNCREINTDGNCELYEAKE